MFKSPTTQYIFVTLSNVNNNRKPMNDKPKRPSLTIQIPKNEESDIVTNLPHVAPKAPNGHQRNKSFDFSPPVNGIISAQLHTTPFQSAGCGSSRFDSGPISRSDDEAKGPRESINDPAVMNRIISQIEQFAGTQSSQPAVGATRKRF